MITTACSHSDCLVREGQTHRLKVRYKKYQPKQVSPSQSPVIIMPPTGGSTYLDRSYASRLCQAGIPVTLVLGWPGMEERSVELEIHRKLLGLAQDSLDDVIEEVGHTKVGLVGTSVGGLHAATALGRNSKVQSAYIIAAGAPIANIIATSDEKTLKEYRQQRMEKFKFDSLEDYAKALSEVIKDKPLTHAESARKKKLTLIIAQDDKTVLTKYQNQLAESFTPDTVHRLSGSHVWAIIKSWWFYSDDMVDFFKSTREETL